MTVITILLIAIAILIGINIIITLKRSTITTDFKPVIEEFNKGLDRIESSSKMEFANSRTEALQNSKLIREEVGSQLKNFGDTILKSIDSVTQIQKQNLDTFSEQLNKLTISNEGKIEKLGQLIETKLNAFQLGIDNNSKEARKELKDNLDVFKVELNNALKDFSERQRENFTNLIEAQTQQNNSSTEKLVLMNATIEKSIKSLQDDNAAKLEKMRETVDEKLQKTLETRLSQSFEQVSKNLESVQKGLGEMQLLATGVGDLKKVLTNVKTRGVLGEYQLENILEQLLTIEQYGKNVKTKEGSNALVEFAVKLPGREEQEKIVWLPIDSKFPKEDFELLMEAYDQANSDAIELHRKNFVKGIKKCASDICEKYVDPPNTTDFAILFLPFESLYAEVLRTPGLFEAIQRECKITITGPTTLSALLNSLQMGFRTLAISKRSSEVWELLGAVKTEFGKFGKILERTHKKLQEASNVIEEAGTRSRAIERKLKNVQQLPAEQAIALIGELPELIEEEEIEE